MRLAIRKHMLSGIQDVVLEEVDVAKDECPEIQGTRRTHQRIISVMCLHFFSRPLPFSRGYKA